MTTHRTRALALLALAGALALAAACAAPAPAPSNRSDAEITTAVRAQLATEPKINLFDVTVDTRDGVVTLSGRVRADADRVKAEKLARGVAGVRSVINLLEVGGA